MPDYNAAVALGLQPPQNDLPNTLNTIVGLQERNALAGYYNLKSLQESRMYQGALAAGQAAASGGNPLQAAAPYGIDPSSLGAYQNYNSNQQFQTTHGGLNPQGAEANSTIARNAAEAANLRAQNPGLVSKSQQAQTEADATVAKTYGPGVLVDPSDNEAWSNLVNKHYDVLGVLQSDLGRQAALNVTDPNGRVKAAIAYGTAAGVPVQDLAKTFNVQQSGQTGAQPGQQGSQNAPVGLRNPAEAEAASEQAKQQAGYFSKLYSGIAALGDTSAQTKNDISVAKAAINDPNFWSGTGENYNLMYKRFLNLGGDPSALPQEVFRKVMAANVLQQTNQMKAAAEEMGSGSSRLFASQIQLMEKAAQNPDNTIQSNRFLTEFASRVEQRNEQLADSAADYKNGKLDPQFEKQFRQDASAPLFGQWELKHLDTVGAPIGEKLKQIDPREIAALKANPKEYSSKFDAYYGPGTAQAALNQ